MSGLAGRRVVVVGASAGIGRAFAVQAVEHGADVVLGARRADVLDAAVAEAGGGTPIPIDVCDGASRERFVAAAAERLGEVDLLLCTAGYADVRPLADTDDEIWARTVATNLVGINRLLSLVRPVLAPTGVLAVLSSETAAQPRLGLAAYAASKAALETSLEGWRVEHPGTRISCVVVGATFPTEFGNHFDGEHLGAAMAEWQRRGLLPEEYMTPEDVAGCLVDVYATALHHPAVSIERIVLRPASPPLSRLDAPAIG